MIKIVKTLKAIDGSKKYLVKSDAYDNCFEVLLFSLEKEPDNYILCISSQVGCKMGCKFCATGALGYCDNIYVSDLIDVVNLIEEENKDKKIGWYSFMGMGEPLDNFDNIIEFYNIMSKKNDKVRFSLSTVGIVDKIYKLADLGCPYYLFVSLHFPFNYMRSESMPINKKYSIEEVMDACDYYYSKSGQKVEISYMLLEGINDTDECLKELTKILSPEKYKIQILLYNDVNLKNGKIQYLRADENYAVEFAEKLKKMNYEVNISISVAKDVLAGCGQMTGKYNMGDAI